jgi:hypothetical protein
MKGLLAALASATLLAGPACAAEASTFAELQRVCLDTAADPQAALASASDAGWGPAPSELISELGRPGFPRGTRWKEKRLGFLLMYAEVKSDQTGSFKACRMIAKPGDATILTEAASWAGLAPDEQSDGWVSYQFYDANGEHLSGNQDARFGGRLQAKAHFRSLGIDSGPDETFMIFVVPIVPTRKSAS